MLHVQKTAMECMSITRAANITHNSIPTAHWKLFYYHAEYTLEIHELPKATQVIKFTESGRTMRFHESTVIYEVGNSRPQEG